ncbi:MAG: methyltransferase domain-containing protein [Candidatus Heimdallarchaeota archaeon]|nr:methyltransferase domain-containing protein [Candidatus Heimdallarchaeota archaeon]
MHNSNVNSDKELIEAYKKISSKYARVKRKPWKDFQTYMNKISKLYSLPSSGILVDIGAGNSRNLLHFNSSSMQFIATDISFELLKASVEIQMGHHFTINNDMKSLSLRSNFANLVLSIATIHHLRKKEETISCLQLQSALLKKDGYLILSCWRRWKPDTRKKLIGDFITSPIRKLKNKYWRHGDIYLPWHDENKNIIARRYYHLFTKRELVSVIKKTDLKIIDFSKCGGKGGKDNFFVLLKKDSLSII